MTEVCTEITAIMNLLGESYIKKLPTKLWDFFCQHKDNSKVVKIDITKPLETQNLKNDTIQMLSFLMLKYLCENSDDKETLRKAYEENSIKNYKRLKEEYNSDNIFNDKLDTKTEQNNISEKINLTEYKKPNLILVILDKLRNFFKK